MKKCKSKCGSAATEANGRCFPCAEELAVLTYEAVYEFTGSAQQARAAAQQSWKGAA